MELSHFYDVLRRALPHLESLYLYCIDNITMLNASKSTYRSMICMSNELSVIVNLKNKELLYKCQ